MNLVVDILVVCRKMANVREVGERFFPLSGLCQSAWTFFAKKHSEEKDTAGHELQRKGNDPLFCRHGKVLVNAVGDPETENSANLDYFKLALSRHEEWYIRFRKTRPFGP